MITIQHIEIYKKYGGDGDGFVRCATDSEKQIMTYKHWSLIDSFIQDLNLVSQGKTSNSFNEKLFKELQKNCENQKVIDELSEIANSNLGSII